MVEKIAGYPNMSFVRKSLERLGFILPSSEVSIEGDYKVLITDSDIRRYAESKRIKLSDSEISGIRQGYLRIMQEFNEFAAAAGASLVLTGNIRESSLDALWDQATNASLIWDTIERTCYSSSQAYADASSEERRAHFENMCMALLYDFLLPLDQARCQDPNERTFESILQMYYSRSELLRYFPESLATLDMVVIDVLLTNADIRNQVLQFMEGEGHSIHEVITRHDLSTHEVELLGFPQSTLRIALLTMTAKSIILLLRFTLRRFYRGITPGISKRDSFHAEYLCVYEYLHSLSVSMSDSGKKVKIGLLQGKRSQRY